MSEPRVPSVAPPETEAPPVSVHRVTAIDYLPPIFMIGLSVAIFVGTAGLTYWADTTPGARFLPIWLSGAGVLLGGLLLLSLLRGGDGGVLDLPNRVGLKRAALAISAMALFALAAPFIGMVPVVALFMIFMLLVVLGQRVVPSLITTAIVVIGLNVIFVRWLAVPLPAPLGF